MADQDQEVVSKNVILKNMNGEYLIPFVGIPTQTGNSGKVLGTNGSNLEWVTGGSDDEGLTSAEVNSLWTEVE